MIATLLPHHSRRPRAHLDLLSIFEDDFGLDSVDGVERIHVWLVAKWVERRTFLLCAAEAVLTSASGAQQRGGAGGHIQSRRASVNDSIDPAAMTGFGIIPNPRDIQDEQEKVENWDKDKVGGCEAGNHR
jgi:hypothetical protein